MMPGLPPAYFDVDGKRAMGYYTGKDLNYYYFMASNFATSDRWFHPVMTRTHTGNTSMLQPRRGTCTNSVRTVGQPAPHPTNFQGLQSKGISWRI